jgi:hypothetical protein
MPLPTIPAPMTTHFALLGNLLILYFLDFLLVVDGGGGGWWLEILSNCCFETFDVIAHSFGCCLAIIGRNRFK